jgi:hypothetical protein
MSLTQLDELNNGQISSDNLEMLCFRHSYALKLLERYGFDSLQDLSIMNKVNGYTLNWALGYLINELNRDDFLPYEAVPRVLDLSYFVVLTLIFSLIILVLLFLIYKQVRVYKSHSEHTRVIFNQDEELNV